MWYFNKLFFSVALHKIKKVNILNDLIKERLLQGRPQTKENFRVGVHLRDQSSILFTHEKTGEPERLSDLPKALKLLEHQNQTHILLP